MVKVAWPCTARPQLSESRVLHHLSKGRSALLENLLTMSDEQKARSRKSRNKSLVVERCHHGLARAGRSNDQIPVSPTVPFKLDQIEKATLKWLSSDLNRTDEATLIVNASRLHLLVELVRVELDEISALPIRLEHSLDLVDHVGVAHTGHAHVPLEPVVKGHVGEIRGADVGR